MAFASIDGIVIHHETRGRRGAPRVAFSNSLGTDFRIWNEVVAQLGDHFEILLYDKRGHGLSDAPPAPYTIADHAADLLGLLDHLGWERTSIVGLSVGGLIGQEIAVRHPARLDRLVLCDTGAKIGSDELWNGRIRGVERDGLGSIADGIITRWFTPAYAREHPAERAGWLNMLRQTSVAGYAGTCAALRDADLTGEIGRIAAPTLALVGDADLSTPSDLVRATAGAIPGARFEIVPRSGHLPCIEQPDETARLIADHLAGGRP